MLTRKKAFILAVVSGVVAVASMYGLAAYAHFANPEEWTYTPTTLLLLVLCFSSVGGAIVFGVYAVVDD